VGPFLRHSVYPTELIFDHPRSGVVYNFGRVCMSVCMSVPQTITFESLDIRLFAHAIYLHWLRVEFVYGHRVRVKVTGAKKVENSYSHNVRLRSAITPFNQRQSGDVCVQYGFFGYGVSDGVTAIFVT